MMAPATARTRTPRPSHSILVPGSTLPCICPLLALIARDHASAGRRASTRLRRNVIVLDGDPLLKRQRKSTGTTAAGSLSPQHTSAPESRSAQLNDPPALTER